MIRVRTRNKRVFEGTLKAVDFRSNLIIHNAVAEIPADQNCPLNAELNTIYDVKLSFTPDAGLSPEEQKRARDHYFASHYFIGAIMISGEDIAKVELRTPPIARKQEEEAKEKKEGDAVTNA